MQLTNSHLFDRKASFIGMKRTADQVPKRPTRLLTILKGVMFALALAGANASHAQDGSPLVRSFLRHSPQLAYFKSATIPDSARMGHAVAAIGDIDQDGIPDMAYGLSFDSLGISANGRGTVMVHFMNADATIRSSKKITSNTDAFTVTLNAGDGFGARVAGIGDLNGDGYRDIAVLSTGDDDGGSNRGAVYILFLDDTAEVLSYQKISDTAGGFTGTMTGGNTFNGCLANLGDLNGDGIIDIGVGAFQSNDGGAGRGALWVLLMNTDGTVSGYRKYSASSTWPGGNPLTANNINFGFACVGLGDTDGDGVNDIAITARIQGNGRIYMMRLNSDGTIKNYNTIGPPSYGGFTTSVTNAGGHFGWSLANAGDLNGDGVMDLFAGMRMQSDGYTNAGAVLAIYLKDDGTVLQEEKISQTAGTGTTPLGLHASAWFGFQVAALGDLDGDHVLDIAVGSSGYDAAGGDCTGSVYVLNLRYRGEPTAFELQPEGGGPVSPSSPDLFFYHTEELEPDAGTKLQFEIIAEDGTVVLDQVDVPLTLVRGTSRYQIPLSTLDAHTTHTLWVTDLQGNISSLQFR